MCADSSRTGSMTGAEQVARSLCELGADVVFTVSGNHNISAIHALENAGIRVVHARHETGAVYLAEGWARMRGEPGVCLVTAGPGFTSALTGLAAARANESPVLLLSAASPVGRTGAGTFQEMDQVGAAEPLCGLSRLVRSPGEIAPSLVSGWHHAAGPVPGPVHFALPTDVLDGVLPGGAAAVRRSAAPGLDGARDRDVDPDTEEGIAELLDRARRPVVLVRPSLAGRIPPAGAQVRANVPVVVADSPRGMADPAISKAIRARIAEADLAIVVGPADFTVRHGRLASDCPLIQITGELDELISAGRQARGTDILVLGPELPWLRYLCTEFETRDFEPLASAEPDGERTDRARSDPGQDGKPLHPAELCDAFRSVPGLVAAFDGGEFGQWARAGLWEHLQSRVGNGKLGAIGGAIPQAIGMSLALGRQPVVAFVGDGTFGYYASEIDTAVRCGASVLVVIGNDARWAAEWHLMRSAFGAEATGATELQPRAYELVAEGYGAGGTAVSSRRELDEAISEYFAPETPGVRVLNVAMQTVRSTEA